MAEQATPSPIKVFDESLMNPAQPKPEIPSASDGISWTASEFIAHAKTGGWYAILGVITLALAGLAYYFADIFSAIVVVVVAILFGYMASRKPRELPYMVNEKGVQVDKKLYPYGSFKSFSIIQEEGIESIWFMPLQRFAPGLTIYFAPQGAKKLSITSALNYPTKNVSQILSICSCIEFAFRFPVLYRRH